MTESLSPVTKRRLAIQGIEGVSDETLAPVAGWMRMAWLGCAAITAVGTILASSTLLGALVVIATLAALSPVHPIDLLYNHVVRHIRKTGPLPKRAAPTRFACALGAIWGVATIWAFQTGLMALGYALGSALAATAALVGTTDICIPSMTYRLIFRKPLL
jgi:hypothetical protein